MHKDVLNYFSKMADRLLKPKKKRKKSAWDLFTIPPRTSDLDRIEKERMLLCINARNKIKRMRRNTSGT